jgi:uncharacterized membrane protein YagU involved in acid resistance
MNPQASYEMSRALPAIFWAGLTCGVLDITAAFVTWAVQGVRPVRVLQGIAGGLLGPKSFSGGWQTAALGAICHFFIAFSAATVFYVASRKLALMTRYPIYSGVLYGIAVYLVMYWIVMPLSQLQRRPFSWLAAAIAIITHMVCVGTPIALVVRHYSK